ncbi:PmbA protein [Hydrogenispora ethanolica]|uniref:PmbA protein n=1 Tax=Hydrogenispora ethanolica TaxID=1082276 RepID=A0A4R1RBK0_HYDET|nr:PmbA protein [Hydrogenispora ethanolica]
MILAEQLADILTSYQKRDSDLTEWRFDLHDTRGLEVGLKDNRIGGPYSAPSYKRSISGEIFLYWKNQRYSSGKLDSQVTESFDEYMNNWKTAAYSDPEGVSLYTPKEVPQVDLADSAVEHIVDRDNSQPFRLLETGLRKLSAAGLRKINGKVRCFHSTRVMKNSAGFSLEYRQTPVEFYFEVNNSYGESFQEKFWPAEDKIEAIIQNTARIGKLLDNTVSTNFSGEIRLLFPPEVFESFLSQFLISNLYGSLVVNRQSRFSLDDFKENRMVLRNDLSLVLDTLQPLRAFSYLCTSEGVPGGQIELIEHGRLRTPILGLKYAKKTGFPPTPVVAGGRGFFIKTGLAVPEWEQLIKNTERGLIVYSVLGMHTQDSSSGSFSLTADQCLLVENGAVLGKVKAVINGDFLKSLAAEDSYFGKISDEDNPGYSFLASATI